MTPQERRDIVISAEGNVLTNVQRVGVDFTAAYTRATIDGQVNALIRMEGAEAAARYMFAVGDRVAGGLREPTDFRVIEIALPAPVAPDVVADPPRVIEPPAPSHGLSRWAWGVLHGAVLTLWFLYAMGRL